MLSVGKNLPVFVRGKVIRGYGRGSKELGFPTANFEKDVVEASSTNLSSGIYYGWANVNKGEVFKMVMSVGWNPYYNNTHKSMETHILHDFGDDFYGAELRVCILGYLREELNFNSMEDLKKAISNDVNNAKMELDKEPMLQFKNNEYFHCD